MLWKNKNLSPVTKVMVCFLLVSAMFTFHGCKEKMPVHQKNQGTKEFENSFTELATFTGGCFWCTESDFEKLPGVLKVISGYTGGHKENPTYKEFLPGLQDMSKPSRFIMIQERLPTKNCSIISGDTLTLQTQRDSLLTVENNIEVPSSIIVKNKNVLRKTPEKN